MDIHHSDMDNFLLLVPMHHRLRCIKQGLPFGFHLDEHQRRSIPGNDVDLSLATTVILLLDAIALALQKLRGHLFALLAAPASPATHSLSPTVYALRHHPTETLTVNRTGTVGP